MVNIRYLEVVFDTHIRKWEVPAFRGAIAKKVGWKNDEFHNHKKDGSVKYGYPSIQYKDRDGFPSMVCIGKAVDQIYLVFSAPNKTVVYSGQNHELNIKSLSLKNFEIGIGNSSKRFVIKNWLPLNQKNYIKYDALTSKQDKIEMLERIMIGNLLSFFKGIGLWAEQKIELEIINVIKIEPITYKKQRLLSFNVEFETNVSLPDHIGLGKGVSVGFGDLKESKRLSNGN